MDAPWPPVARVRSSVMGSVRERVAARGGLAATREILAAGFGRGAIRAALLQGDVFRVRQGWYAIPGAPIEAVRAVRVGGRLTCVSGLRAIGCWDLKVRELHVSVPPTSARLRRPDDKWTRLADHNDPVKVHWRSSGGEDRFVLPALECFSDAVACVTTENLIVLADSYLHRHPQARSTWAQDAAALGDRASALLAADGVCESGTETLFYRRLSTLGMRRQVAIPGIGRVDFIIGERLVIEVDGAEHHADRFEADRRRDALLSHRGYRVLRFTYWQVMARWPEVEAAVWAAIARGDRF